MLRICILTGDDPVCTEKAKTGKKLPSLKSVQLYRSDIPNDVHELLESMLSYDISLRPMADEKFLVCVNKMIDKIKMRE